MSRFSCSSASRRLTRQCSGRCRIVAAAALLSLTSVAHNSAAQDDAAINDAYELSTEGLSAFNAGRYGEALDKFTHAFSIVELPALAVHMARADVKLGRFVAAAALYEQATQLDDGIGDPQVQARARAEAKQERAALLLRTPKLLVRITGVEPSTVSVLVDGARLPLESFDSGWPLDPGTHKIAATFDNQRQEQLTSMAESEAREVRFAFSPLALQKPLISAHPEQSSPRTETTPMRTAAWASFGVGGAGLLVFGTTGIVALSKSEHFKSIPCGQLGQVRCDPSEQDSYNTWRTLAGVGFYTGAAGLVTAAALYFAEPSKKKTRGTSARMLPWVGVGSAGVEGSF